MQRIKHLLIIIIIALSSAMCTASAQTVALKTNTLYWLAGGTMNASLELALSNKVTFDLLGAYNPWTYKDDKKMRLWLAQPELRYWFCEKFEGHFIGLHFHGGQYYGGFNKYRYDGYLLGAGLSYGYSVLLSPHWNMEFELGLGYAYMWYKRSDRIPCYRCHEDKHKNYVGPTKAAVSIVYIF